MGLLETVEKKIPTKKQKEFEYGMLLAFIEQNRIRTVFGLKRKLDDEILKVAKFLAKNKSWKNAPINRVRREYARTGKVLNNMKKLVVKHL